MAKIPRKFKRQLRKNISNNEVSGSLDKFKQTWAFGVGDVVEYEGERAIVVEVRGAHFLLMNRLGTNWRRGSKIRPGLV